MPGAGVPAEKATGAVTVAVTAPATAWIKGASEMDGAGGGAGGIGGMPAGAKGVPSHCSALAVRRALVVQTPAVDSQATSTSRPVDSVATTTSPTMPLNWV